MKLGWECDMTVRFTVEKVSYKGYGIGTHAIRYTPEMGLSFHALIAGDILSDAENVLQEVADVLNSSEVGK